MTGALYVFMLQDYQDLEVALSEIPVNPCTCSELVRLCLRRRDTSDDRSSNTSEEEEELDEDEVVNTAVTLLPPLHEHSLTLSNSSDPDQRASLGALWSRV